MWAGALCVCPRRHRRVHPHGDPAAEARRPNTLALCPREHSTTCRRQREGQEKNLAAPGYARRRMHRRCCRCERPRENGQHRHPFCDAERLGPAEDEHTVDVI